MLTGENKKVTINFANENVHILDISQIQQAETGSIKIFQRRNEKTAYQEARIKRGRNKKEQPNLQLRPLYR